MEKRKCLKTKNDDLNNYLRTFENEPLLIVFKKHFENWEEGFYPFFELILEDVESKDNHIIENFNPENRKESFSLLGLKQKEKKDVFVSIEADKYDEYILQACDVFFDVYLIEDVFKFVAYKSRYNKTPWDAFYIKKDRT